MDDNNPKLPAAKLASPFLTTTQAADFIGLSDRTLERMRTEGQGPDYRKHGRYVRYHINDLKAWSTAHLMHCTNGV
jgi:excisionase family DNA binding protein